MAVAQWWCRNCKSVYRAKLFRCPRCHGPELEEYMAKITRHGGASDHTVPTEAEPAPDVTVAADLDIVPDEGAGLVDERTDSEREADENAEAARAELDASRPAVNAPKADWVAYAVDVRGHDPDTADDLSKARLIELYGPNG